MKLPDSLTQSLYARPLREQALLAVGGFAIVVLLTWVAIIKPVNGMRDKAQRQLDATRLVFAEVDQLASRVEAERAGGKSSRPSGSMTELIDSSLRKHGLTIRGIQPGQQGEMFVRLEAAPTPAVWRWLHEMEAVAGVGINELTVNPTDKAGFVLVTARLAQPR